MEFLIDTSMELGKEVILKILEAVTEHASSKAAHRARARNAEAVRDFLQPQLDKLEEEIKDLAEGTYKTSLSHLHHALVILKEKSKELYGERESKAEVYDQIQRQPLDNLPESVLTLLNMSYDKAYTSFNYTTNLPLEKRATAMQVVILCIGLLHIREQNIVFSRWEKCIHDLFKDETVGKCIEKNITTTKGFAKFLSGHKSKDLESLLIVARDVLTQIIRVASRNEVNRSAVTNLFENVVRPLELQPEVRSVWADKLKWENYTSFIRWRDELRIKDAGAPFDACASLPDGGIVLALGNDALIRYGRDLDRVNFCSGAYYALSYDPSRQCLWGFSKKRNSLIALDLMTQKEVGQEMDPPILNADYRLARWHIAVSNNGDIVLAAQLIKPTNAPPVIYLKPQGYQRWHLLKIDHSETRSKVTDVAVAEQKAPKSVNIVLASEGRVEKIHVGCEKETPEILSIDLLFPDRLQDHMSCTFDEDGLLVVVVRRQMIYVIGQDFSKILASTYATRSSGAWVVAGQRAIWTPTLTGDLIQYEYFML